MLPSVVSTPSRSSPAMPLPGPESTSIDWTSTPEIDVRATALSAGNSRWGHDNMHARHYTPYVGRFLQVDPVLGSTGSPQSWNRYAYANNDPVNFTDPTGEEVYVQAHRIFGSKYVHMSILIEPKDQARWSGDRRFDNTNPVTGRHYATIGAGPGGPGHITRLVSGVNRGTDKNLATKIWQSLPLDLGNADENAVIAALFDLDALYNDALDYSALFGAGFNSNSYVTGLLQAAGLDFDASGLNAPRSDKSIPAESFKASITVIENAINEVERTLATERQHNEWVNDVNRMYDVMCPSCNFGRGPGDYLGPQVGWGETGGDGVGGRWWQYY